MYAANCAVNKPIVPDPHTKTFLPGPASAACAALKEFPPGSINAPTVSSIESGKKCNAVAGTNNCSASAPAQPFLIPISNLFSQTCWRLFKQR